MRFEIKPFCQIFRYNDDRRFPDFSYITDGPLTDYLDCIIISHFHLDHCGALPYMTEMVGYNGPIYMTQPTKALCPVLLVGIVQAYIFET